METENLLLNDNQEKIHQSWDEITWIRCWKLKKL